MTFYLSVMLSNTYFDILSGILSDKYVFAILSGIYSGIPSGRGGAWSAFKILFLMAEYRKMAAAQLLGFAV